MICPNLADGKVRKEFTEIVDALGRKAAHSAWHRNNGYPLDKAFNGEPSKLFQDILNLPEIDGDRKKALLFKSNIYKTSFIEWFGDWRNEPATASKVVDSNGEPLMVYHGTRTVDMFGKDKPDFEEFDKSRIGKRHGLRSDDMAKGFYFGSYKIAAKAGTKIMPVFLDIKEDNNTTIRKGDQDFGVLGDVYVAFESNQIKSVFNQGNFNKETANIYYQGVDSPFEIDHTYFFNRLYNQGIVKVKTPKGLAYDKVPIINTHIVDGKYIDVLDSNIKILNDINNEFIEYSEKPLLKIDGDYVTMDLNALGNLKTSPQYASLFLDEFTEDKKKVLDKLQSQFNVPYVVVNDKNTGWKGKFENGVVFINKAKLTDDTMFHEYAHPFVDIIEKQNPELFKRLRHEVLTSPDGKAELRRVQGSSFYRESKYEDQIKEAMVSLIGRYGMDNNFTQHKNLKYYLKTMFQRMMEYFKSIVDINGNVDISKIDSKVTLRELATIFNTDLTFDVSDALDTEWYQEDDTDKDNETKINLEQLTITNDKLITELQGRINDYNMLITEEAGDDSKEKEIQELNSLLVRVSKLDARQTFMEIASKALKDLNNIDAWITNPEKFKVRNATTDRRLHLTAQYLKTYREIDRQEFAEDKDLQTTLIHLNKKLSKIERGLREATNDYVSNVILENTTNPKFIDNKEVILAEMKESDDMGKWNFISGTLSSDKNVVIATLDRVFKQHLDRIHERNLDIEETIGEVVDELIKSNGGKAKGAFDYMFNLKDATTVDKISPKYYEKYLELKKELKDDNNIAIEYKELENAVNDKEVEEFKKFNIDLAQKKKELSSFLNAEYYDREVSKYVEGKNHKYTAEFKKFRDYYQDNQKGKWVKSKVVRAAEKKLETSRDSMTDTEILKAETTAKNYENFMNKFYSFPRDIRVANTEVNPQTGKITYTGDTRIEKDMRFVRREFIDVQEFNKKGEVLWGNDAYHKIKMTGRHATSNPSALQEKQLEFYDLYTKYFDESNNKLPSSISSSMKGRAPSILKHVTDRFFNSDAKLKFAYTNFKNSWKASNFYFSHRALTEEGKIRRGVPILYTNNLKNQEKLSRLEKELSNTDKKSERYKDLENQIEAEKGKVTAEDISTNLGASIISYAQMANNYQLLTEFESFTHVIKDVVANTKYHRKNPDNSIMKAWHNEVDSSKIFKEGISLTQKRIETFLNSNVYSDPEMDEKRASTISKKIMNYTSVRNLAFNIFSGVNNLTIGAIFQNIEMIGGQYMKYSNYVKAGGYFTKFLAGGVWKELNQGFKNGKFYTNNRAVTKLMAFVKEMDVLQDQTERYGVEKAHTFIQKLWEGDFLYVSMNIGEFANQIRIALGVMMDETIEDKDGNLVSLWDAHAMNDKGRFVLKDGFNFSEKERSRVRYKILEINKQIHGSYRTEDKNQLQSHWAGQMMMHFHKWVNAFVNTRVKPRHFNEPLGMDLEGRYLTMATVLKNLYEVAVQGKDWQKLDPTQKANMLKNAAEAAYLVTLFALWGVVSAAAEDVDDEDETTKRFMNWLAYQDSRAIKEITLLLSPIEVYQNVKNPLASLSMLREAGEVLLEVSKLPTYHMLGREDELYYDRGINKDRLKLFKQTNDIIPVVYIGERWHRMLQESEFYIG